MRNFVIVLLVLCLSFVACQVPASQAKTLCLHPFMNGGQPTVLPDEHGWDVAGRLHFKDGDNRVTLTGAYCITAEQN